MKKKAIIGILFSILAIFSLCKVQAYSGEIDPKGYITLPNVINIENGVGTGTISVSQSGYNISYQKIDVSESTYNAIVENGKELVPNYTSVWTKVTNGSNNVQLDFSDYSGKVYFVLWAKIENGTDTFYDYTIYSNDIKNEAQTPRNVEQTPQNENQTPQNVEWTDFSNAKFELKKDGVSGAIIQISNITPKDGSYYYLFITSNNSKPNVTKDNYHKEGILLVYDSDNKMFRTSSKVARYVELNQDLYVSIVENNRDGNIEVVRYGQKIERYSEPKYSDAFFATYMSYDSTQIITQFTHATENNRKIQIKVGKITDNSILQKIKNQDSSGFANLLSFAKSNNGIYNKTMDAQSDYAVGYDREESLINLSALQDNAYYFLYVKAEDENGKYISNEAVTLALSEVHENGDWFMFFYGSNDFKWADFGNVGSDITTAGVNLPKAGINIVIWVTLSIILIGGGTFSYIQYRRNNI